MLHKVFLSCSLLDILIFPSAVHTLPSSSRSLLMNMHFLELTLHQGRYLHNQVCICNPLIVASGVNIPSSSRLSYFWRTRLENPFKIINWEKIFLQYLMGKNRNPLSEIKTESSSNIFKGAFAYSFLIYLNLFMFTQMI